MGHLIRDLMGILFDRSSSSEAEATSSGAYISDNDDSDDDGRLILRRT